MAIITRSYFEKGETKIANAADLAPNSDLLGNGVSLEQFIARYERDILTRLLGYDLYSQFKEQFDIDPATGVWTIKGAAADKWKRLLNGYEYTKDGVKVNWQGLIFADGGTDDSVKQSLIAYYVYTKFIEATAFQNTGVGMSAASSKNSKRVDANADVALAFNDFYALAIGPNYNLPYNNFNNGSLYQYEGYFSGLLQGNGYKSLYDFISDMNAEDPTTFTNWIPNINFKLANRLGL